MSKWKVAHLVVFGVGSVVLVGVSAALHPGSFWWPVAHVVVLGSLFALKVYVYSTLGRNRKTP